MLISSSIPLLLSVGQEEGLHLLSPEGQLVLGVAPDCLHFAHGRVQTQQEVLKALQPTRRMAWRGRGEGTTKPANTHNPNKQVLTV